MGLRQRRESETHSFLQCSIHHSYAGGRGAPRLVGLEPERPQPRRDVLRRVRPPTLANLRSRHSVRSPYLPCFVALLIHEPDSESALRRVLVVCTAPEAKVVDSREPAPRDLGHMIE